MKKLSKTQERDKAALAAALRRRAEELAAAVAAFNAAMAGATQPVEAAVEAYNAVLAEARAFAEEVAADMDSYQADRSDAWQESEKGQAYDGWKDEWNGFSPDDLEVELPDDVEEPQPEAADELEALPDQPE